MFPSLRVYTCTGYNEHYMYLNQGQQTMPNGLVRLVNLPNHPFISLGCLSCDIKRYCSLSLSIRVWVGSTATLVCGWTAILCGATAVPGLAAPRTAAPSSQGRKTSSWTISRSGQWASPPRTRTKRSVARVVGPAFCMGGEGVGDTHSRLTRNE